MVQTSLVVYGFFQLLNPDRQSTARRSDPNYSTYYCVYDTALQCVDGSGRAAQFRIFSPPGDTPFEPKTVAFLEARAYVPLGGDTVLLEGIRQAALPGKPSDSDYQSHAPNLPFTIIYGVGIVKDPQDTPSAPVVNDKEFHVEVAPWVRDSNQSCTVICVLPSDAPRWKKVPIPRVNTIVHFSGICGRVRQDNSLEITIDDVQFNVGQAPALSPTARMPTGPPPAKRQRFDAEAFISHPSVRPTASSSATSSPLSSQVEDSSEDVHTSASSTTARSTSPVHSSNPTERHTYTTRAADKRKTA